MPTSDRKRRKVSKGTYKGARLKTKAEKNAQARQRMKAMRARREAQKLQQEQHHRDDLELSTDDDMPGAGDSSAVHAPLPEHSEDAPLSSPDPVCRRKSSGIV